MDTIYETILENELNGVVITTKFLRKLHLTDYRIKKMVNEGIIKRISIGKYTFCDVNIIFNVGVKYIDSDLNMAKKYFQKYLEIDENNYGALTHLFLIEIKREDYQSALKLFDKIYKNQYYEAYSDALLYLYLLGLLTDLGKYENLWDKITLNNILINEKNNNYQDKNLHNEIREDIYYLRLAMAHKSLKTVNDSIYNRILMELNSKAYNKMYLFKSNVLKALDEKNFDKAYELIVQEKKKYRNEKNYYLYIDTLEDLIKIRDTKVIPKIISYEGKITQDFINNFNYKCAYEKNLHANYSNQILNKILKEILDEIKKIEEEKLNKDKKLEGSSVSSYLYNNGFYEDVLKYYKEHASKIRNLTDRDYALMGLSLLHLGSIRNGLKYLAIASNLSQLNKNSKYDFSQYINYLQDIVRYKNKEKEAAVSEFLKSISKYDVTDEGLPTLEDDDYEMLQYYVDKTIKERDMCVIENIEESKISLIEDLLVDFGNINFSVIGEIGKRKIVLRYFNNYSNMSESEKYNIVGRFRKYVEKMDFENAQMYCQKCEDEYLYINKGTMEYIILTYVFTNQFSKALNWYKIYYYSIMKDVTASDKIKFLERLFSETIDQDETFEFLKEKINTLIQRKSIVIINLNDNIDKNKLMYYCKEVPFVHSILNESSLVLTVRKKGLQNNRDYFGYAKKDYEKKDYQTALINYLKALDFIDNPSLQNKIITYIISCYKNLNQNELALELMGELNCTNNNLDQKQHLMTKISSLLTQK